VAYERKKLNSEPTQEPQKLEPANKEFSLVVPKIQATAPIIKNVNPFDSDVYQRALTKGIAHAQGTDFPGEENNIFLFSHSSEDFYEASRYNSIFYLLHRLTKDDKIIIYYQGKKHTYQVTKKQIVSPEAVQYLQETGSEYLRLMTCWPPGTTLKRLLITARPVSPSK